MRKPPKNLGFYPDASILIACFWLLASLGVGAVFLISAFFTDHWYIAIIGAMFLWFGMAVLIQIRKWYCVPNHERLSVQRDFLAFSDQRRGTTSISAILFGMLQTKKRLNFQASGTDSMILLRLEFVDGSVWCFRAGHGPFTAFGPNLGQKDTKALIEKMYKLAEFTGIRPARIGVEAVV